MAWRAAFDFLLAQSDPDDLTDRHAPCAAEAENEPAREDQVTRFDRGEVLLKLSPWSKNENRMEGRNKW